MLGRHTSTLPLKVLKTNEQYEGALNELESLIVLDPSPESPEVDRLELLTVLVREYESRTFKFEPTDPVDAIEYRMSEQRLRQKDLAPYLGGKNRASEILARKRSLTLDMIRALHEALHIPLQSLVAPMRERTSADEKTEADDQFEWNEFPVSEMRRRGWFEGIASADQDNPQTLVRKFLEQVGEKSNLHPALFRRTFRGPGSTGASRYSLIAWTSRLLIRAKTLERTYPAFDRTALSASALRNLAELSTKDNGPWLAQGFLKDLGIVLLVEPGLPGTLVDGAALLSKAGHPVIGLTLRFDRVDSFWFTLFHELAHVEHHLSESEEAFIDRTDDEDGHDPVESEADLIARDTLIPRAYWRASSVSSNPTKTGILAFAKNLNIHPAIVAGRVRFESKRYDRFGELLGQGRVRTLFPEAAKGKFS
ncbi:ImmA/IrrE family metallo-endopeptidase [Tahibacter soli]|uniref:ImmA/IrrE family metallo-endopeptidase n=1 Tax=Tahibacter soli TaxID=2983605 RepID=A0A9X3YFM4_9GAMM|nr:ImmA/IrrE family metallo-endopeptidase [Tahibacter soli]MDC8010957.1 ImmA/IrrE family metallo-endopeptidase [Tahibacter soli]